MHDSLCVGPGGSTHVSIGRVPWTRGDNTILRSPPNSSTSTDKPTRLVAILCRVLPSHPSSSTSSSPISSSSTSSPISPSTIPSLLWRPPRPISCWRWATNTRCRRGLCVGVHSHKLQRFRLANWPTHVWAKFEHIQLDDDNNPVHVLCVYAKHNVIDVMVGDECVSECFFSLTFSHEWCYRCSAPPGPHRTCPTPSSAPCHSSGLPTCLCVGRSRGGGSV